MSDTGNKQEVVSEFLIKYTLILDYPSTITTQNRSNDAKKTYIVGRSRSNAPDRERERERGEEEEEEKGEEEEDGKKVKQVNPRYFHHLNARS